MTLKFFLPMKPPTVTHQCKRVAPGRDGRVRHYEDGRLKAAREKLMAHLAGRAPAAPLTGALRLLVKWCFPLTGRHRDGQYKTTRPDTDNLQKLLKDCMTDAGFWTDDAQVVSEICEKFYAALPGLYIAVEQLEDAP